MKAAIELESRRFTAEEVLEMVEAGVLSEDEPLELLDGRLVQTSPQGPAHSMLCTLIRDLLLSVFGTGHVVLEAKPIASGSDSLPVPDLAVFRGSIRDFADRHPSGVDCLLVVEVAVTSLAIDRAKAAFHAAAGVPIYWVLDVGRRRLEVHSEPQADGRYRSIRILAEQDVVELPEGRASWTVSDLLL